MQKPWSGHGFHVVNPERKRPLQRCCIRLIRGHADCVISETILDQGIFREVGFNFEQLVATAVLRSSSAGLHKVGETGTRLTV